MNIVFKRKAGTAKVVGMTVNGEVVKDQSDFEAMLTDVFALGALGETLSITHEDLAE